MEHGDCRVLWVAVNVDVLDVSVLHGISPGSEAIGEVGLDELWTRESLQIKLIIIITSQYLSSLEIYVATQLIE